ncbi:hypothetical protein EC957_003874 [Mortierella hygrophila]|uniref:Uncharacterized protein n=1 Tax=Mortierella hygrophila TaxID=979708 RepID=A0A9P6F2X0_9FUNG|nr:hypothetical protein EC957_003874 [Mortierella hygrophila]
MRPGLLVFSPNGQQLVISTYNNLVRIDFMACQWFIFGCSNGTVRLWRREQIVSWDPRSDPQEYVTKSSDKSVRVLRVFVGNDSGVVSARSTWGSNLERLCIEGSRFKDTAGFGSSLPTVVDTAWRN